MLEGNGNRVDVSGKDYQKQNNKARGKNWAMLILFNMTLNSLVAGIKGIADSRRLNFDDRYIKRNCAKF